MGLLGCPRGRGTYGACGNVGEPWGRPWGVLSYVPPLDTLLLRIPLAEAWAAADGPGESSLTAVLDVFRSPQNHTRHIAKSLIPK